MNRYDNRTRAEDALLATWRDTRRPLRLHTVNGEMLTGTLLQLDTYGLIVQSETGAAPVLVFKHAVALVEPLGPAQDGQ